MSRLPRPVIPPPLPPPLPADMYEPRSPPIVVVTGPQPQPDKPWNPHSVLAYVKAAVLLCFLCGVLFAAWFVWQFANNVRSGMNDAAAKRLSAEATARKFAIDSLEKHGVSRIATNSKFLSSPPRAMLVGLAEDSDGTLREYTVAWRIAEFDGATRWQVRYVMIGGIIVEGDIIGN